MPLADRGLSYLLEQNQMQAPRSATIWRSQVICIHVYVRKIHYLWFSELETKTETLGPGFTSFQIVDLLYGRTYIFTIRPLYGEVEGPLTTLYQRTRKTTKLFL